MYLTLKAVSTFYRVLYFKYILCLHRTNRTCVTVFLMNVNKKLRRSIIYFTTLLHVPLSLRISQVATQFSAYANSDDIASLLRIVTSNYVT